MRYGIIGTGAIGAYYGGKLAKDGQEVHFLLHSDYETVVANGLHIHSVDGSFTLQHVNAYQQSDDMPACDVVVVALKTTQQHLLPQLLKPLLKPDTVVLLIQNGIGLEEDFATMFRGVGVLGGLAFICSTKVAPGVIEHTELGNLNIGNYNCTDENKVKALVDELNHAGVKAAEVEYHEARWKKAVWNMCFNGLTVALDARTDQLVANPDTAALCHSLMSEVIEAAQACGVATLRPSLAESMMKMTREMTPYAPSMKVDYDKRRPMEFYYLYARPVAEAARHGYDMKQARMLHALLAFKQQAYIQD